MVTRGNDALVRLPATSVRAIDVRNGKHRLAPAAKWAVLGGVIWGGIAAVLPLEPCTSTRTEICGKRSDFVTEQALGMAIITGVVGAVRGEDRWVRLEGTSPTAFIAPSGRGGMAGLRMAF